MLKCFLLWAMLDFDKLYHQSDHNGYGESHIAYHRRYASLSIASNSKPQTFPTALEFQMAFFH